MSATKSIPVLGPDPRFASRPAGAFWASVPARERTAEELEALRELVALSAAEAEEERAALGRWLDSK